MFARTTLPADPVSAGVARRFVRRTLADWRLREFEDAACLLVSELVTNAILHAASPSVLTLAFDDGVLHIEVSDSSSQRVRPRTYSREAGTGRGLMLVEALSAAWGSGATNAGKFVWFDLDVAALSRGELTH
jgi:anti-sigma regulatory factor (Ser/Thr protein kinase)